jgi:serine/threonine-protein kinase ATR
VGSRLGGTDSSYKQGKTFEIPEKVPFRLTHNMVDALGVTGVEGEWRKLSR